MDTTACVCACVCGEAITTANTVQVCSHHTVCSITHLHTFKKTSAIN